MCEISYCKLFTLALWPIYLSDCDVPTCYLSDKSYKHQLFTEMDRQSKCQTPNTSCKGYCGEVQVSQYQLSQRPNKCKETYCLISSPTHMKTGSSSNSLQKLNQSLTKDFKTCKKFILVIVHLNNTNPIILKRLLLWRHLNSSILNLPKVTSLLYIWR